MTKKMKAAIFVEPGKIEVQEIDRPTLQKPTDAILRIVRTCVCGSDLWWFRGIESYPANAQIGHEALGIVEEVGDEVTHAKPGDFVVAPFSHGCGHCAACRAGFDAICENQEEGLHGYQAQYLRFTNADWALIKIPGQPTDYSNEMLNSLLTLADVMPTGFHAGASAEVKTGDTAVVIGDGAVGLSAVIGARLQGANRIISLSHHEDRAKLARKFGATDIVTETGDAAVQRVMELTKGDGADAVLECVGATGALEQAVQIARPGAIIGRVGVPQTETPTTPLFWKNIGLRGGVASVTTYDRNVLLTAVLDGMIEPGRVFTKQFDLDHIQDAYEAMDQRQAIKSLITMD